MLLGVGDGVADIVQVVDVVREREPGDLGKCSTDTLLRCNRWMLARLVLSIMLNIVLVMFDELELADIRYVAVNQQHRTN